MGPAAGSGAYSRKQKVGILDIETNMMSSRGPGSTTHRNSSVGKCYPSTRSRFGS